MGVCCYCGVHEYKTLTIEQCCKHLDQVLVANDNEKGKQLHLSFCLLNIGAHFLFIVYYVHVFFYFQPSPFQLSLFKLSTLTLI